MSLFQVPDKERDYKSFTLFVMINVWTVVFNLIVSLGFYFFPCYGKGGQYY